MKLVEPSVEEIKIDDTIDMIAKVARNCYLSTPKEPDEAPFVSRLINNCHFAMVEHKALTFVVNKELYYEIKNINNPFVYMSNKNDVYLVTLSLRPIAEAYARKEFDNPLLVLISALSQRVKDVFFKDFEVESNENIRILSSEEISNLSYEERKIHQFVTMKIITDRGVSHELVRHRRCSFAQESTRYCNYSKNKFNGELSFIKPIDYEENKDVYETVFATIEKGYMDLASRKVTPDKARAILPNALKTSIVVTTNLTEWELIFGLRLDFAAHHDMRRVIQLVKNHFVKEGYIEEKIPA